MKVKSICHFCAFSKTFISDDISEWRIQLIRFYPKLTGHIIICTNYHKVIL